MLHEQPNVVCGIEADRISFSVPEKCVFNFSACYFLAEKMHMFLVYFIFR